MGFFFLRPWGAMEHSQQETASSASHSKRISLLPLRTMLLEDAYQRPKEKTVAQAREMATEVGRSDRSRTSCPIKDLLRE